LFSFCRLPGRTQGVLSLALFIATSAAFAQNGLERVGPNGQFGYPIWYQDKTGLALEFCSPTDAIELAGGWCVILSGDTTAPEIPQPTGPNAQTTPWNFFDEHFYWLANASGTVDAAHGGGKAKLVLALEGAFGGGPALPGDQIAFARTRAFITNLTAGTYKVYHPYGTIGPIDVEANGRVFVTDDVGIACPPGQFDCALGGKVGPFLLPSTSSGGAELGPVAGPGGKLYIADPARLGPVTGGITGQNHFRVVAVNSGVETDVLVVPGGTGPIVDFSLNGRISQGTIPGRVKVERAAYNSAGGRVEVFASVFPTVQSRLPGASKPPEVAPQLGYYHGNCDVTLTGQMIPPSASGQISAAMTTAGHVGWGQTSVGSAGPPAVVCVEDKTSSTLYEAKVVDDVKIASVLFSPNNGKLTVIASSSNAAAKLSLVYPGGEVPLQSGSVTVDMTVPPNRIQVSSDLGGSTQARVLTDGSGVSIPLSDIVVAQNLNITVPAGQSTTFKVPNAGASGHEVVLTSTPAKGVAQLNPSGTNALPDTITYSANADAGSQTDSFLYVLKSVCVDPATVPATTTCTPISSAPATVTVSITATTPPPPAPGTTETATVTAGSAAYRRDQNRWTAAGTDNIPNQTLSLAYTMSAAPAIGSTLVAGSYVSISNVTVDALGNWAFDARGSAVTSPAPTGAGQVILYKTVNGAYKVLATGAFTFR